MTYEEYIQQELAKAEQALAKMEQPKAKEDNNAADNFYRRHFRVTERHLNGVLFYDVHKLGKLPVIFSSSSMDEVREFQRLKLKEDKDHLIWCLSVVALVFFFDILKEMLFSFVTGITYVLGDLGSFVNFMLNLIS